MNHAVVSTDPRTGSGTQTATTESTPAQVGIVCRAAAAAAGWLEDLGRLGRAELLETIAAELESDGEQITAVADRETALGEGRLTGELARTSFQFRFFADVLRDGGYLEATIDHADGHAVPAPRPDLRRMLVPLGPVAVFGASNFPLALSVPGGDTASALAAGCPVVVKAHPAHPATSEAAAAAIRRALNAAKAPAGVLGLVHGHHAGSALVRDPRICAVGFTGSVHGGRALFDLASSRPDPIPFYGELGSLNPLVVTPGAAATRTEEIGRGTAQSILLGLGQFCTKPGLIFVPADAHGERLVHELVAAAAHHAAGPLLADGIRDAFLQFTARLGALETAEVLLNERTDTHARVCGPALVRVTAADLAAEESASLREEHFGPFAVIATYTDFAELHDAIARLEPALVATIHATDNEADVVPPLLRVLRDKAGRIVWNGYPTGVAVSWAMHHGGPYPATTNPLHTSVGATAIRRWLRPIAYQSVPDAFLPEELREASADVPQRVGGALRPVPQI